MIKRPGGAMVDGALPSRSQLLPVFSKWKEVTQKSHLGPMVVTIFFVLVMYTFAGDNSVVPYFAKQGIYTSYFIIIIAVYLNLASFYFIYRLAGKKKSWLGLFGVAAFTGFFMSTPLFNFALAFFHQFLAGGEPNSKQDFILRLYKYTVAAGLFEELAKAVPIFILFGYSHKMTREQQDAYGVQEPLDGILLGVASAAGFAIVETLGQYVSNSLASRWVSYAAALTKMGILPRMSPNDAITLMSQVIGCSPGVQLAVPRSLDQAFGHMAYSGYFGYFIGLAALKPTKKALIITVGLGSAALVHGIWDAAPAETPLFQAAIAVVSYGVLAAAILKARDISPQRDTLEPSIVFGSSGFNTARLLPPTPAREEAAGMPTVPVSPLTEQDVPARAAAVAVAVAVAPAATVGLRIGTRRFVVVHGLRLLEHQIPGVRSGGGDQVVAEVNRHPQNPGLLGLKNLSQSSWTVATSADGWREIGAGQTLKLAPGTTINFGTTQAQVE